MTWYVAVAFTSGDSKSLGRIFRPGDGPYTDEEVAEWFTPAYFKTMRDMGFFVIKKVNPLPAAVKVANPVISEDGDVIEAPQTVPDAKPVASYPTQMAPERENVQRQMPVQIVEEDRLPLITAKEESPVAHVGRRGRKK